MTITNISTYAIIKLYLIKALIGIIIAISVGVLGLLGFGLFVAVLWGYREFKQRGKRQ